MGEEKSEKFKIIDENSLDSMESISEDSDNMNFNSDDDADPLNNNGIGSSKMQQMIKDWEEYMSGKKTEQPSSSSSCWGEDNSNNNNNMADIEGIISKDTTSIYTHPNSQNALLGPEDLDVNLDLVNIDIDPNNMNNIDLDGDLNLNSGDGELDSDMKMDELSDIMDRKLIYPLYTDDIPYVRPKKYNGYEPSCTITSSALGEIYENVDIFKDDAIKAITAEMTGECTIHPIPLDSAILPAKKDTTEAAPMKSVDGFLVPAPVKKRRIKVKEPAPVLPKPIPSKDPWATEIIPLPFKPQNEGQNRTQGYKKKTSPTNTSVIKQILNEPPGLCPDDAAEPEEPTLGVRDYHRDAHTLLSTIRVAPEPQRYVEPYRPHNVEPYRPRAVEPYRPRDVEPYRPRAVEPYQPREVEPYQPRDVEPYRQRGVEPYRPREVEPYRPRHVGSHRPRNQERYRPTPIEPIYDLANYGFPSTSYGFSPATSEGFNNAASHAFYNPMAGFDHNPYNPTQYSTFGNYPQQPANNNNNNNKRKSSSKPSGIIKYADGCVVRSPFDLPRATNETPTPTFNYFSEPYDNIIKRGNKVVSTTPYDKDKYKKDKEYKK